MENIASSEELKDETSKVQSDSVQYESDSSSSEPNHDEALITEDDLVYEKEEKTPKLVSPYDRPGKWYVVHTQSGYENKVQGNLAQRIQSMNKEDSIHEVVIPLENVVEFKQGKRVEVQKKMFPGYILVRCRMNDEVWNTHLTDAIKQVNASAACLLPCADSLFRRSVLLRAAARRFSARWRRRLL